MKDWLLIILLAFCIFHNSFSQLSADYVLLIPTNNSIDSLPEMALLADSSELYQIAVSVIEKTFISESMKIYGLVQNYLVNKGIIAQKEPAYLALTNHQGGYARQGFILKKGEEHILKPNAFYIDISASYMKEDPARLMSVTQLFPHELGHAMYRLLSSSDSLEETSKNVNVHFFSLVTDYAIAFNEGFAEHMENVARHYEPDQDIKNGIIEDTEIKKNKFESYISGFEHDYQWPLRLSFYKAGMIVWYQQFENYKRFEYASNNLAHFKNKALAKGSVPDRIAFRNAGVRTLSKSRNIVQALATEGVTATFFTQLSNSDLINRYQSPEFYKLFLFDTSKVIVPSVYFSPIQNQMLKYFHVLHHYVTVEATRQAQLIQFVKGYCHEFPDEARIVKELFKKASGNDYTESLPPEVWFMVKDYQHSFIVLDQFQGLTIPVYTFNLNAVEVEDLLTIDGLTYESANLIITYREKNGYFQNIEHLNQIGRLDAKSRKLLQSHAYDQDYMDHLPEPELNIKALFINPMLHITSIGGLYFTVIILLRSLMLKVVKQRQKLGRHCRNIFSHLFYWLIFLVVALILLLISGQNIWGVLTTTFILLIPGILYFRKKREQLIIHTTLILTMGLFIVYSIY